MQGANRTRIAILCSGLDGVHRGYESHCRMLFESLRSDPELAIEPTLIKGDGKAAEDETSLGSPRRDGALCRWLARFRSDHLYWEYLFFAASFLIRSAVRRERYASIVCIEPMVAKVLCRLRLMLPGRPRITFTHGVWMVPPEYDHGADCIHEVNVENYDRMKRHLDSSGSTTELVCIPHFLPDRDPLGEGSAPTRESIGIKTRLVALAVGVIDSDHKRTDHVIREVASLGPDWTLLACGKPKGDDGQRVMELGRSLLGDRFVHVALSREEVWKAYAVADVFVLGSLNEGFGLVLLEALQAGLPVIAHDRPLFRWIVGSAGEHARMDRPGELATKLRALVGDKHRMHELRQRALAEFRSRFTWKTVRADYARMILGGHARSHP